MLKAQLNLLKSLSLIILLIPSLKAASPPRDPQPSSSNTGITHVFPTGEEIGLEEISAVGGYIPAIYIVRLIKNQLAELETSQRRTMETVKEILEKQRENPDLIINLFKDRQFLGQHKHEQNEKEQPVLKLVKDSQFTEEQLEKFGYLTDALKDKAEGREYLEMLENIIHEFKEKVKTVYKEIAFQEQQQHQDNAHQQQKYMLDCVHQLRVEHVNFLEQIRLEVQLHYEFPKELRAFKENAKNLANYKKEKEVQHVHEIKEPNEKLQKGKLSEKKKRPLVKSINTAVASYLESVKVIDDLLNLNNMAENLYKEMEAIWPFKHGDKYVMSIMEVAEIAAKERSEKDLYEIDAKKLYKIGGIVNAKNYLTSFFNMCDIVHSILRKLPSQWHIEIHNQIRQKLEMPLEWYLKMHTAAYPDIQGEYEPTEEMVHLRVELLLAKTLLVYERLNKSVIDGPYKVWKEGKMPEELPYRLLKPYDQLKQERRAAAAPLPMVHGQRL